MKYKSDYFKNNNKDFCVYLFNKNGSSVVIDGISYPVTAGTVIATSPFNFILNDLSDSFSRSISYPTKSYLNKLWKICAVCDFPIVAKLSSEDLAEAKKIISLIDYENDHESQPGQEIIVNNLIEQLFILAVRNSRTPLKKACEDKNIITAIIYILSHLDNDISLNDIAKEVHCSPNYFGNCFLKYTGLSFKKYLMNTRLSYARKLIEYTDLAITEISSEAGFNSAGYFSVCFKNHFGESPVNYRKHN